MATINMLLALKNCRNVVPLPSNVHFKQLNGFFSIIMVKILQNIFLTISVLLCVWVRIWNIMCSLSTMLTQTHCHKMIKLATGGIMNIALEYLGCRQLAGPCDQDDYKVAWENFLPMSDDPSY